MFRKAALTILMVSLALPAIARADTFFVSTSGSDGWPGTSSLPWRTLQHAADQVGAGDTVLVASGTYAGFKAASSGSQGAPITFRAADGAAVVLNSPSPDSWHGSIIEIENCDWWVIEGFEVTGSTVRAGIDARRADHVTVRFCHAHHNFEWGIFTAFTNFFTAENNECSYSSDEHGIYVSNSSDDCVLTDNHCHHNNACGIQINADPSFMDEPGDDGVSSRCLIARNVIHDNGAAGGAGINLASVRDSTIANNLLYANLASGIAGWDDGQGSQWGTMNNSFLNNTVHQPSTARWALSLKNGSLGNDVKNNILLHDNPARGGLELDSSSLVGLTSNYAVMARVSLDEAVMSLAAWQSGYSRDTASFSATPAELFMAPGNDYHLAADSPAVDSGAPLALVTGDLDGRARPLGQAYDRGCYERSAAAALPAALPLLLLHEQ